jgi:RHS repeat-associated protein
VASKERIYFAGRMIMVGGEKVVTDRLGSVVRKGTTNMAYYPYGQERTSTPNDTAKFGTYTRDAATGLDYAMTRYYQSTWGRFTTADQGPPVLKIPQSWNRYLYSWNDPVNLSDPDGMLPAAPPGCMAYPFGVAGGSIDTSSNCPPGYAEVDGWGGGNWSSISLTGQVHNAVTLLEDIVGAVVSPAGRGYGITVEADFFNYMADVGAIRIGADGVVRIGGILVSIEVIAQSGGAVIPFLTNPVTITVVGVAALGAVAYYMARRAALDDMQKVRRECEDLAHAQADRLGWIRYGKEWVKYYSECIRTRVWTK